MRRFGVILFGMAVMLAGLAWLVAVPPLVDAGKPTEITLKAGKSLTVKRSGCDLSVVSNTASEVKVHCAASKSSPVSAFTATPTTITLKKGNKLNVIAKNCTLSVPVQRKAKVKISCTATAPAATVHVGPSNTLSYSQVSVTIHKGQTVKWTWDSGFHTVTSTSDNGNSADGTFCSPNDKNCITPNGSSSGATYTHTFNTTGTFVYFCQIHGYAQMHAQVIVQP